MSQHSLRVHLPPLWPPCLSFFLALHLFPAFPFLSSTGPRASAAVRHSRDRSTRMILADGKERRRLGILATFPSTMSIYSYSRLVRASLCRSSCESQRYALYAQPLLRSLVSRYGSCSCIEWDWPFGLWHQVTVEIRPKRLGILLGHPISNVFFWEFSL